MKTVQYERTWCDYLTKCKHFPDIEVGSYECDQCKFCKSMKENKSIFLEPCDYRKYTEVILGEVECSFDD